MVFHLANNMHFAGTAVKLQGKDFITVDQLHGRRFPAINIAFCLFRTQKEGEAETVLGEHHPHVALLCIRFIDRVDQLHTVAMIEFTRLMVVDVRRER